MLAAALGLAASGAVNGQTLGFYAREHGDAISREDKAVAVAFWEDTSQNPVRKWAYTAGYVTQNDGSGNPHTRLAVFKYPADAVNIDPMAGDPPGYGEAAAAAYFPPSAGAWTPVGQHSATAMTVDPDGNVYVTGYTTMEASGDNGTDRNYVTIKYDDELNTVWTGTGWGGVAAARGYDHSGNDDAAVSIAVDLEYGHVIVTGTSSNGSNTDIATLRYDGAGDPYTGWSNTGAGTGVRRYDAAEGEDTAAEVGYFYYVEEDEPAVAAVIVGTSYRGTTPQRDRVVLCYADDGSPLWTTPNIYGAVSGGDDFGTGLAIAPGTGGNAPILYVCGYSETNTASPPEVDYVVARLDPASGSSSSPLGWNRTWDPGDEDVALDIAMSWVGGQNPYPIAWVTGRSEVSGHTLVATAVFDDNGLIASGGYTAISGGDNSGNAICAFEGSAMVAGTAQVGVSDTDVLVLWYTLNLGSPASLSVSSATFPGNAGALPDDGWAIVRGDGADVAILCGASTYTTAYLRDIVTLRIEGP